MTPEEAAILEQELQPVGQDSAVVTAAVEEVKAESEDFNPLGKIEGWSAFECSSGPFGHRG